MAERKKQEFLVIFQKIKERGPHEERSALTRSSARRVRREGEGGSTWFLKSSASLLKKNHYDKHSRQEDG